MEPFTRLTGIAAPLMRPNIDTDAIIPKAWCKRVTKTGFGPHLFHDWRYLPDGAENPDFVLNRPPWRAARILVAGANFGCGSSREAAVWALAEFGIRCVIAPSFADIFAANCCQNGVLPVALGAAAVTELAALAAEPETATMTVDLVEQRVGTSDGRDISFDIDPYRRRQLLEGLDEIALTLAYDADIAAFEERRAAGCGWLRPRWERAGLDPAQSGRK